MELFPPHVIEEKEELDLKLQQLRPFLKTQLYQNLPEEEQARMLKQCVLMECYSDVLGERIAAFSK